MAVPGRARGSLAPSARHRPGHLVRSGPSGGRGGRPRRLRRLRDRPAGCRARGREAEVDGGESAPRADRRPPRPGRSLAQGHGPPDASREGGGQGRGPRALADRQPRGHEHARRPALRGARGVRGLQGCRFRGLPGRARREDGEGSTRPRRAAADRGRAAGVRGTASLGLGGAPPRLCAQGRLRRLDRARELGNQAGRYPVPARRPEPEVRRLLARRPERARAARDGGARSDDRRRVAGPRGAALVPRPRPGRARAAPATWRRSWPAMA